MPIITGFIGMQQVKVIDKASGEVLFGCTMEEREKAYAFATEMENVGLDVEIISQSLNETLGRSLGMSEEDIEILNQTMEEEIDSHNDCCSPDIPSLH